ncbi:MAG: hypothetical protein COA79_22760 [Planctomycetota bacterium]|nr:MAG: hypothetical protein COA79_22760 [Planctomycetota bacterium]
MTNKEFESWLTKDEDELVNYIVIDITRHVSTLNSSDSNFYGYAILPSDYYSSANAPTIVTAFNFESDISTENKKEAYYRYSVDEWANYYHDGFESSNKELELIYKTFISTQSFENYVEAYNEKLNSAYMTSLTRLKENGVFSDDKYLIIWLSDSRDNIMSQSAKAFNTPEIYKQYASEFE